MRQEGAERCDLVWRLGRASRGSGRALGGRNSSACHLSLSVRATRILLGGSEGLSGGLSGHLGGFIRTSDYVRLKVFGIQTYACALVL